MSASEEGEEKCYQFYYPSRNGTGLHPRFRGHHLGPGGTMRWREPAERPCDSAWCKICQIAWWFDP